MIPSGQKPLWSSDKAVSPQIHWTQRLRAYPLHLFGDVFHRIVVDKTQKTRSEVREQEAPPTLTQSSDPPEEITHKTIVLRRSTYFLLTTLLGVEIIFDALLFLLRIPFMFVSIPFFTPALLTTLFVGSFVLVMLIKFNFMLFALLKWLSTHYVIGNGEIRYQTGILNKKEKIFFCALAQEVVYSQTFLGRILNYGTIEIYNPAIKEKVYLDTIPDPQKYVEKVKENMPQGSSGGYIIERQ